MSNDKKTKAQTPVKAAEPTPAPVKVPPMFRRFDWLAMIIAFASVWAVYLLTLAPQLTLEDSGELCTGSYYAGIPHPPGYPFWAIYSWFWTFILPIGNVAWRVEVGQSFASAMGCGLLGLMVSRGSSMMMEGIAELKDIPRRSESAICVVAGFVAGTLIGYNGYMWSQSVIVEVYSFSVLSLMGVQICLLRWIYAPKQWRYLGWAFFIFGLCFTNHQTLIVAAMGIEVAIAAARPRRPSSRRGRTASES